MRLAVIAVALAIAAPGPGGAAEKPSFAGTWRVDVERSTPTAGRGRYFEQDAALAELRLVITQTADEVVIDRHVGERTGRSVLKLDGTETVAEGPRGGKFTARVSVGRGQAGHRGHAESPGAQRGGQRRHDGGAGTRPRRQDADGDHDDEGASCDDETDAGVREGGVDAVHA